MNQKDIKLLWGRAASRCSICRIHLSQDSTSQNSHFVIGEQAHIVGEREDGPRGLSPLTLEERNSYHNIILLCPNHHTEIDKNVADWPVEKLHFQKSMHELWIFETLSATDNAHETATQIAIGNIIDTTVSLCQLESWKEWTSWALSADPKLPSMMPSDLFEYRQIVLATLWPSEYEELQRAVTTLSILLKKASDTFMKHAQYQDGFYIPDRFYRANGNYNPNYDQDLERFNLWIHEFTRLVVRSTCAANWFADVVRRDINPTFFVNRGKFRVVEGPFEDLTYRAWIPELTEAEKVELPNSILSD